MNLGNGLEKVVGVVHRHGEHVGDAFAAVPNLKRFPVEAFALARFAGDVNVGQEVHFHGADAWGNQVLIGC